MAARHFVVLLVAVVVAVMGVLGVVDEDAGRLGDKVCLSNANDADDGGGVAGAAEYAAGIWFAIESLVFVDGLQ